MHPIIDVQDEKHCYLECQFLEKCYGGYICKLYQTKIKLSSDGRFIRCAKCQRADVDIDIEKCPKCGAKPITYTTGPSDDGALQIQSFFCEKKGCGWIWTKKMPIDEYRGQ